MNELNKWKRLNSLSKKLDWCLATDDFGGWRANLFVYWYFGSTDMLKLKCKSWSTCFNLLKSWKGVGIKFFIVQAGEIWCVLRHRILNSMAIPFKNWAVQRMQVWLQTCFPSKRKNSCRGTDSHWGGAVWENSVLCCPAPQDSPSPGTGAGEAAFAKVVSGGFPYAGQTALQVFSRSFEAILICLQDVLCPKQIKECIRKRLDQLSSVTYMQIHICAYPKIYLQIFVWYMYICQPFFNI